MAKEEQALKIINDLGVERTISEFIVDYNDDDELREELIRQVLNRFRWRDTNIEPPTKEGEYIVFNGQIDIGEWYGDGWGLYDVTHWMPKPEAPKKENNMKRQDELNEAWCKYRGKCSTEIMQALAFALRWCDEHHNWISVEDYTKDELPPLIDKNNPYGESVQVLFVVVLDGVQYINKGNFDYDTGVWHSLDTQCSFCKENVTHWMPLPSIENLKKGDKNE